MGQYGHDGGHHGDLFSYTPDWQYGEPMLTGFPENDVNMPATILDTNEAHLMTNFFHNPDGAFAGDQTDWLGNQANLKLDGSGIAQLPDFVHSHQSLNGPSFSLGGQTEQQQPQQGHLTHFHNPNQQHVPRTPHVNHAYNDYNSDQGSVEAINAAVNLQNLQHMQTVRHHSASYTHSSSQHMNGMVSGSWGGIEGGQQAVGVPGQGRRGDPAIQSPLTSSGRQSSNSFHDIQQQQQLASPVRPGYHTDQGWAAVVQSSQYPTTPSAHQQTHQPHFHGNHVFAGQPTHGGTYFQTQQNQQQIQRPASGFGSDTSFGSGRYQPPRDHMALEMERGSNLNNVPFAQQLAAQSLSHAHPMSPEQLARARQAQTPHLVTSFSQAQFPTAYHGGLPNTAPPTYNRNYSASNMPVNNAVSPSVSDEDVGIDNHSRKRGKKARDDGDDDYNPTGGSKKARSRRASKVAKVETLYDGDEIVVDPTANGTPAKRRKTSSDSRSSPGSQEYTSPRGNTSETPEIETKSGSKKKKKGANHLPRNNLTDEEKRQNHIRSEKLRRDLIKAQYDALDSLVPGLKNGKSGLSRADVLLEIVNFVENVARGNQAAEELLKTWTPPDATPGGVNG